MRSKGARPHPSLRERSCHTELIPGAYVDYYQAPISQDAYHIFFRRSQDQREKHGPVQYQENGLPLETRVFPFRLYYMLEEAPSRGFESIVSWQSHGRAFAIHEHDKFEREIMPM